MTTIQNITDEQIRTLRDEAAAAGDRHMVVTCDMALDDSAAAVAAVIRAINEAEAQAS